MKEKKKAKLPWVSFLHLQGVFLPFSFSFPKNSKNLTSLLRMFRNDLNIPPKGVPLLRGFSQTNHLFPKHSLQSWHVSRNFPHELPKLHAHKFVAHPKLRNIFSVYKLTMLFVGVLNSRANSLQLGGHDVNQKYMKMTKDVVLKGSSQQAKKDFITRRNGQGPKHLKFFLLVFLK